MAKEISKMEKPVWLRYTEEEAKAIILKLANKGLTSEKIGLVLKKENGLALLVAPKNTEVEEEWSEDFPEVFQKLKEEGFNPSQWIVPSIEQLKLAYENIPNEFSPTFYWSGTEGTIRGACPMNFNNGTPNCYLKTFTLCVRAFRCVTY